MSGCQTHQDFCVAAGETFHPTLRWATTTLASAPITGITQAVPVVITAPNHGLPDGWPCTVVGAQGMTEINAGRYPPQGDDWHKGTVLTASAVQLNAVSSADYQPYVAGGFLVYSQPASLVGVSATMTIWDNPEETGTPLATLVNTSGGIAIDPVAMTLTPFLQTAGLAWKVGYYRLEATDANAVVTQLMTGTITID